MKALRKIKLGYGKTYNPGNDIEAADLKKYPHIQKWTDGKESSKEGSP